MPRGKPPIVPLGKEDGSWTLQAGVLAGLASQRGLRPAARLPTQRFPPRPRIFSAWERVGVRALGHGTRATSPACLCPDPFDKPSAGRARNPSFGFEFRHARNLLAGIQAGRQGCQTAMDSRQKIAGMTTMKFARHAKTFGDSSSGQALPSPTRRQRAGEGQIGYSARIVARRDDVRNS